MKTMTTESTRKIAILTFPGCSALDVTGPHEVFAVAGQIAAPQGPPPYEVMVLSRQSGKVPMDSGIALFAEYAWHDCPADIDTLLVGGGPDITPLVEDGTILGWLRNRAQQTRRVGSICTGAFALAEAGLLDGYRATTHWKYAAQLARDYPHIAVDADAIFVRDGRICTSAGITSGMDMALALVEEDLGRAVALETARMLVLYLKRPGGQSQFSSRLRAQAAEGGKFTRLLAWLADNFAEPLSVEEMAEKAVMSPRNFARVFVAEMGVTPARYLEQIRMEEVVHRMESSGLSLDAAARECGFKGADHLRTVFRKNLGITPREYRQRFRIGGTQAEEQ